MEIEKYLARESFAKILTLIGSLSIFRSTLGDTIKIKKEIGKPIKECSAKEYTRLTIKYVCFYTDKLIEGKYKPKDEFINDCDLEKLSVEDIETFSKVFINHESNDYLTRKIRSKNKTVGDCIEDNDVEYENIEKSSDEKYFEYFHRLSVLKEEEENERYKKIFGSIKGLNSFPENVIKNIKSSYMLGDSISSKIGDAASIVKSVESPWDRSFNSSPIGASEILKKYELEKGIPEKNNLYKSIEKDMAEISEQVQSAKEAPFKKLGQKLDNLIDISKDMLNFTNSVNKTQVEMASSIKESASDASFFAKISIFIAILLASVSIFIGECSSRKNNKVFLETQTTAISAVEELKEIKKELKKISESQNSKIVAKELKAIKEELKLIKEQRDIVNNRELKQVIDKQHKKVSGEIPKIKMKKSNP